MKRIISCFLSFLLLIQTSVYSQVVNPTKGQVAEIYNKVSSRINSSPVFKGFSKDEVTPVIALSAFVAADFEIETEEQLAALLEKYNIPANTKTPVDVLADLTSRELKTTRVANEVFTNYASRKHQESLEAVMKLVEKDPYIVYNYEKYLEIKVNLETASSVGLSDMSLFTAEDLSYAENLFNQSCKNAKVEPKEFIGLYNNVTEMQDLINAVDDEEGLLADFSRKLQYLDGYFKGWKKVKAARTEEEMLEVFTKNYEEYTSLRESCLSQEAYFNEFVQQAKRSENPASMRSRFRVLQSQFEEVYSKYLRSEGERNALSDLIRGNKNMPRITRNGQLFPVFLALIFLGEQVIKATNVRSYMSNRNRAGLALQDAIDDNRHNLYALLEQLDDKDAAFNYIAESYFEDFKDQTADLIFALAVLEKPSDTKYSYSDPQQELDEEFNAQFDKAYQSLEDNIRDIELHI